MQRGKKRNHTDWGADSLLKNQEEKEMRMESGVKKQGSIYQQGGVDKDTDQDSNSSPATYLLNNLGRITFPF